MPRGDGLDSGSPRKHKKRVNIGDYVPKSLARRRTWWDRFGTKDDPGMNRVDVEGLSLKFTKYDGIISYLRPGSQKK